MQFESKKAQELYDELMERTKKDIAQLQKAMENDHKVDIPLSARLAGIMDLGFKRQIEATQAAFQIDNQEKIAKAHIEQMTKPSTPPATVFH